MTSLKMTRRALLSSILALILCFSMLLGTTFAWFTDSESSTGNVIKTGKLDVGFRWADGTADPATATWADVEGAIFNHDKWEPGYAVAKHLKISNDGTLALNYSMRIVADGIVSKLADVIDVYVFDNATAITAADVENAESYGTLTEVLGTNGNLSKKIRGSLKVGDEAKIYTLVLKMQEAADDKYQGMDLGCTFSIELLATQCPDESDIFGNGYDNMTNVPDESVPAALVTTLDELNISATLGIGGNAEPIELDAGYQFEPTISADDVEMSKYKHWHPDFYVYSDRDVPAGSIALAGYYSAWCQFNNDNWVALTNDGMPVDGGEENGVRLVSSLACVTYKDICKYGNDGTGFRCGIAALDDELLAGTTITVEFRLYETENEWSDSSHNCQEVSSENYIVLGTFKYTFPKVVDSQQGLADALTEGGTITLEAGEYKMPSAGSTADVTITGTEDTVVDVTLGAYMDHANVTFKGVTIKTSTGMVNGNGSDYAALYTPDVTYIDCTFIGPMRVGRDGAKFINCTFNSLGNDYVWTCGNDVTFEGCTFNTDGKAILIYSDGGSEIAKVTVKNCTFNSSKGATAGAIANQNCAAIEIHNYGNGVDLVTEGNTYDANFSGEWRIKTYEAGKTQVFVNGVEYTQIAVDGKLMTIDADKNVTVQ